jgi:hypothetical protein
VRNPLFDASKEKCHAVFATDTLGFAPEWFARAGGELYLAGLNSTNIKLPEVATDVKPSERAIEQLTSCARAMMTSVDGRDVEVLRQGLVSLLLGTARARYSCERSCLLTWLPAVLPPCDV